MYIPLLAFGMYIYIANRYQKSEINQDTVPTVVLNLVLLEISLFMCNIFIESNWLSSILYLPVCILFQDLITFSMNLIVMKFILATNDDVIVEPYYMFNMHYSQFIITILFPLLLSIWVFSMSMMSIYILLLLELNYKMMVKHHWLLGIVGMWDIFIEFLCIRNR
jgi:hypothetical protein